MRTLLVVAGITLIGVGAGLGYISAQGTGSASSGALTAQDYADIQQLYWRYNHGSDFRDADLFSSAFTDDAVFKTGPEQEAVGRDAIAAFISQSFAGQVGDTGRRHWNSSWRITPSAEGARGRTYWLVLDVSTGEATHSSTGYYDDVFVKTSDGWRIRSRTLNFDAG